MIYIYVICIYPLEMSEEDHLLQKRTKLTQKLSKYLSKIARVSKIELCKARFASPNTQKKNFNLNITTKLLNYFYTVWGIKFRQIFLLLSRWFHRLSHVFISDWSSDWRNIIFVCIEAFLRHKIKFVVEEVFSL